MIFGQDWPYQTDGISAEEHDDCCEDCCPPDEPDYHAPMCPRWEAE